RCGSDRDVAAEHDGARGCGALIDGQHERHDYFLALLPGCVVAPRQADWEWFVNICSSCPGIAVRRTASLSLAYDPGIHQSSRNAFSRWIAGSSPAMTTTSQQPAALGDAAQMVVGIAKGVLDHGQ